MCLEIQMLSEVNQMHKLKYYMAALRCRQNKRQVTGGTDIDLSQIRKDQKPEALGWREG